MSIDTLKPKPNRRKAILIAAFILFFSCGACGVISMLFSDEEPAADVAGRPAQVVETVDPSAADEQAAIVTDRPADTPRPSDTPQPTNTPRPTNTPIPTPTATRPPDPIVLSGSGDAIVDVDKWDGPAIVHITGNSGARHFAVINYDAGGNYLDLLVNTTDPYDGVRPLDFYDGVSTTRFEVTATGDWQIEVLPLLQNATLVNVPGQVTGRGDAVLLLGDEADVASVTGNAAARHFALHSYGRSADLLVNTTDPYDGQVLVPVGSRIMVVTAEGEWAIVLTGR